MRPFLTLCAVVLISALAVGQQLVQHVPFGHNPFWNPFRHNRLRHDRTGHGSQGSYDGGYTYAPLITTPMLSFQTVSPDPIGASNATAGLAAGATNATMSDLPEGDVSSDYTEAVWYQGGSPEIAPQVSTWPIPRETAMPGPMTGYGMGAEHAVEHERHHEKRAEWTYFSGPEYTTPVAGSAKSGPSKHMYTNEDVTRQNDKNGEVHFDSKTEKIQ